MTIYDLIRETDKNREAVDRVIPQLIDRGWRPGEFVDNELPASFDYFDKIMRQRPRR